MTDDDRAEYLRHLEADALARYGRRMDPLTWAIDRHMTRVELAIVRAWRWLRRDPFATRPPSAAAINHLRAWRRR